MRIERIIPSMYQRRLLLLLAAMFAVSLAPAAWMVRLTVARGAEHRAEAEKRLINQEWLGTVRGQITDRHGRVLALDRASFDIAVDYPMITGQWADTMAAKAARAAAPGEWRRLSPEQRDALVRKYRPAYDRHLDSMWDTLSRVGGIARADLDERRAQIREQVQLLAATVAERQRLEREKELLRDAEATPEDEPLGDVRTADVHRPIREQGEAHVLLHDVPDSVGFELDRLRGQTAPDPGRAVDSGRSVPLLPGLRVSDSKKRTYPLENIDAPIDLSLLPGPLRRSEIVHVRVEGVATHALGWMREKLFKEDVDRRPAKRPDGSADLGCYRPGDAVGQGGIEQASEDALRGLRGVRTRHLDTGVVETIEPLHGQDLHLTIDAMLQARIQALFDPSLGLTVVQPWHKPKVKPEEPPGKFRAKELPVGTALNGSVVVLDVQSGDILAMVSLPSFTRQQAESDRKYVFGDALNAPYLNRAINKPYPPGSIVKPLILASAITGGRYDPEERIACTGHFFPDKPLMYRCWIFKQNHTTHSEQFGHDLNGSDAIKGSCNIFFFEMGKRLGPQGIIDAYGRFGVGPHAERWNIFAASSTPGTDAGSAPASLIEEFRGSVPDVANAKVNEAILMGIGQGPVLWTPLHAADAYATLARGGIHLTPRLIADAPQKSSDLRLDSRALAQALDGLRRCAEEENGTTHAITFEMPDGSKIRENVFTADGVTLWAKSGTADAPPFIADLEFNGAHEAFDGDHAWCVLLAGEHGVPKLAIAVVVDYGGSGGKVAGPVANQVVHALIAEGYLGAGRKDMDSAQQSRAGSGDIR